MFFGSSDFVSFYVEDFVEYVGHERNGDYYFAGFYEATMCPACA
jgi:hypothetical protein